MKGRGGDTGLEGKRRARREDRCDEEGMEKDRSSRRRNKGRGDNDGK